MGACDVQRTLVTRRRMAPSMPPSWRDVRAVQDHWPNTSQDGLVHAMPIAPRSKKNDRREFPSGSAKSLTNVGRLTCRPSTPAAGAVEKAGVEPSSHEA